MIHLVKEFREFAVKGNMIDIAIGVVIGAAFNNVVDVLVKQVIMPPLSMLTAGTSYKEQKIVLKEPIAGNGGTPAVEEIAIHYGMLFEVLLDFLIIGITVFAVVKVMNRFRRKAEDPKNKTVIPARNVQLLENIDRLLQEQNELLRKK